MRRDGFTLLEVMIAVFIVGLLYGFLLELVAGNLAALSRSRHEVEVARLAEVKVREVEGRVLSGEQLTAGVEEGAFEEPHEEFLYSVSIEPFAIPLPDGFTGQVQPSPIFVPTAQGPATRPVLARIETRVFTEEDGPENAQVFSIIAVLPDIVEDSAQARQP